MRDMYPTWFFLIQAPGRMQEGPRGSSYAQEGTTHWRADKILNISGCSQAARFEVSCAQPNDNKIDYLLFNFFKH